jgi:hypothetical protein
MEASAPKRGKAGNGLGQREGAVEYSESKDDVSRVDTTTEKDRTAERARGGYRPLRRRRGGDWRALRGSRLADGTYPPAGKQESQQYRTHLLPEDKIAIVNVYPSQAHTIVIVGNRVNDAPALAQSDVGIAMGTTGKTSRSQLRTARSCARAGCLSRRCCGSPGAPCGSRSSTLGFRQRTIWPTVTAALGFLPDLRCRHTIAAGHYPRERFTAAGRPLAWACGPCPGGSRYGHVNLATRWSKCLA